MILSREKLKWTDYKDCGGAIFRGTVIGSVIGAIPAAGAAIAAFISYNTERVFSKKRELLGTGILEGIAAPEAANNAVTGTSLIPLLTLGIPGSGGAAALLGAFMCTAWRGTIFVSRQWGAHVRYYAGIYTDQCADVCGGTSDGEEFYSCDPCFRTGFNICSIRYLYGRGLLWAGDPGLMWRLQ